MRRRSHLPVWCSILTALLPGAVQAGPADPYTDLALVVLSVLGYFTLAWVVVGRDPPRMPVVVQHDPPEGMSPAAVGYLDRRGYDRRQLTAAIMSLARRGVAEIEETGRRWTVRRVGPIPATLPPDERAVAKALLPDDDALVITGISHRRIHAARRALRGELRRRFQGRYFQANRGWFLAGLLLSLIGFWVLVSRTRTGLDPAAWTLALSLLIFGFPIGRFLTRGYLRWRIDLAEMTPKPSLLAASVFPVIAAVPLGFLGLWAYELWQAVPPHLFLAALLLSAVCAVFYQILERPTVAGQALLDHVEGFKQFLSATDADRIARQHSKEAQELFERLLPYAVALGLKNRWATLLGDAVDTMESRSC